MKGVKFIDKNLKDFFGDNEPFIFAETLEGEIFRQYENRTTKRFQNLQKSYFLKFHGPVGWAEIFKNLIQLKTPVIGAQREYEALSHLDKNKINAPQVKGFGNKGLNPADSFSFLITEELYETISLEDFFLEGLHEKLSPYQKKKLIQSAADLIRRMHLSGLNHRDLYLCHLHIKKEVNFDNIEIHLIDLHRAQIRSNVPKRWLVKDLGGFIHSVLQFNLSEKDFYRFMMSYYQCSFMDLMKNHREMIDKILERAFSMYLKPTLKEFSFKSSKKLSENSPYLKRVMQSGRWISKRNIKNENFMKLFLDESILLNSGEVSKNEEGHLIVKVKIQDQNYYIKKYRIKGFLHGMSRLFKKTRAHNSWTSSCWLNAAGIQTAKPILLYEDNGIFGARTSFFVTEEINGKRLDQALEEGINIDFTVSKLQSFFKRMSWIGFSHGDAKTSNFYIDHRNLVVFDLDSAGKSFPKYLNKKSILRDKERILTSLAGHHEICSKLIKRFQRSRN